MPRVFASRKMILLALALTGLAVMHIVTLRSYPAVHVDEGLLSSTFWSILKGRPELDVSWLYNRDIPTRPDYGIYGLTEQGAFAVFGLDYVTGRAVSLLWGALLLGATWVLVRLTHGREVAWLAVAVLGLSWPFLISSHLIRPDGALAALGVLAVCLPLIGWRYRSWIPHLFVGPLLVVAFVVHENAAGYALGIGLLYLWKGGHQALVRRDSWLFAGSVALGAAGLLLYQHLQGTDAAGGPRMQFQLGTSHALPVLVYSPGEMLAAQVLQLLNLLIGSELELVLLVTTLVWSLGHRTRHDQPHLILLGGMLLFFTLFVQNKAAYYTIQVYPFICALFASAVWDVAHEQRRFPAMRVFGAMSAIWLIVAAVWQIGVTLLPFAGYDYDAATAGLRAAIPPGSTVLAAPEYWLALPGRRVFSLWDVSFAYQYSGRPPADTLTEIHPELAVLDPETAQSFPTGNPYAGTVLEKVYPYQAVHFPLPGHIADLLGPNPRTEATLSVPAIGQVFVIRTGWNPR